MSGLQFNVSQLLKSEVGDARRYDFAWEGPLQLEDASAREISGTVKFTLTNFGVIATGNGGATVNVACARCLDECQHPASIEYEDEYQPEIDVVTGQPSATHRSSAAFEISQTHTIDLTEAVRQHLVLAIEMIPLCTGECKGLCITCGANLNLIACDCPPTEDSGPFTALQSLLSPSDAHA